MQILTLIKGDQNTELKKTRTKKAQFSQLQGD